MKKIAIGVHGGASEATSLLKNNLPAYEQGLKRAVDAGYAQLEQGNSAVAAVEAAVKELEDNPLFNAGRGSVLNSDGEIEMDAAIMDGKTMDAGAVAMVQEVKNPVSLALEVMKNTKHVLLSGYGALLLARRSGIPLMPKDYFVTDYQYQNYMHAKETQDINDVINKKITGTVGAVALDEYGNLASATSTGGTSFCLPGRIGDSCVIGAGCYANNNNCAVSGTGEGEALLCGVVGHTIAMLMELKGWDLQQACTYVVHKGVHSNREMGVIAVNAQGEVHYAFNTEIMKRASINAKGRLQIAISR